MKKVYDRNRVQQQQQQQQYQHHTQRTIFGNIEQYGKKRKFLAARQLDDNIQATKKDECYDSDQQNQPEILNKLTKCAKMTDENGIFRNGSINGVGLGIARNHNHNLNDFNFTTTPSSAVSVTATTASITAATTTNAVTNSANNNNNNRTEQQNNNSDLLSISPINSSNGTNDTCTSANSTAGCASSSVSKPSIAASNNNGNAVQSPLGGRLQFFKGKTHTILTPLKESLEFVHSKALILQLFSHGASYISSIAIVLFFAHSKRPLSV